MNRIFRTLWSYSLQIWVVTSELAKSGGKRGSGRAVGLLLLAPLGAGAANLPSGGTVVSGSGHLSSTGQQLTVDQTSPNLAIDWQSFDIGTGHGVTFHQPSSQAVALNRVVGQDASRILGNLEANGRVFLVNPNGILFGQGASVNVGGLVASTLDIANSDFEQGRYRFKSQGTPKSVLNQGSLNAKNGGAVALLGGQVSNQGVIVANGGSVALAAGQAMTLDFAGDGLLSVKVDEATADALAENRELIRANGGQVLLTAHAGEALLKTVVNNSGVIEAQTLAERGGKIELLGGFDGGTVQVAGTLDASAPTTGNGGFVETSGAHVQVADGTHITTKATQGKSGTWLLDPTDFTVSAGTTAQSDSGIGASTLAANLQNGNVTLQTVSSSNGSDTGTLSVNSAVSWSADTTLTLNAHGDLYLNAPITATGASAGLALNYGGYIQNGSATAGSDYHVSAPVTLSGTTASLSINGQGYGLLHSLADLQAINTQGLGGNYALAQDLEAVGTTYNSALIGSYSSSSRFSGTFAGMGHSIRDLTIDSGNDYVGLFGYVDPTAILRDLALVNASVSGRHYVGALVGYNRGTISNAYATGSVSATDYVGGLVGMNSGTISNAYATGSVSGTGSYVGGLVGWNDGTISNAYATGSVSGTNYYVGGLIGWNGGTISNAYTTGSVSGTSYVGGLVGYNRGTISNAYATGSVSGTSYVGGLVGFNNLGTIISAYATGSVSGRDFAGGLVGVNSQGTINNAYATGSVSGSSYVGGLIGANTGSVSNASWDVDSTGQANAIGNGNGGSVTSLTSVGSGNRYNHSSYGNLGTWSLLAGTSDVYVASDGAGNPAWIMLEGQTRPFLASEYSTSIANAHQLQLMAYNRAASYSLSADIDASQTAGSNASGTWSSAGFSPVGDSNAAFTGSLSGANHRISGLTIDSGNDYVGLFGFAGATATLRDLALVSASVSGRHYVGALVGYNGGTISNASVTGSVSGRGNVGGLVGVNSHGTISNASVTGSVSSSSVAGGLVGYNGGTISNAYATGSVSGTDGYVGGLVGVNNQGTIGNAYATGSVSGAYYVGGLVGYNDGTISNAYATGSVSGTDGYVGGLVGFNSQGTIGNAYATGSVSGSASVGGLVGYNDGTINNSFYATTKADGTAINNAGATNGSFSGNGYGTAKTWAELTQASTFAGWDIARTGGSNAIWRLYDGYSTPLLRSFLQRVTLTVNAGAGSKTYDGTAATGSTHYTGSSLGNALDASKLLGSLVYTSNSKNAGTYRSADGTLMVSGLYSGQQGYDISYADASLLIVKASISAVTGITAENRTYDGGTAATLNYGGAGFTGLIGSDTLNVNSASGAFTDKNAGAGKTVNITGITLGGSDAGNYVLANTNASTTANITPKSIAGSITAQDKTYDGTAVAMTHGSLDGTISGDAVSLSGSGHFTDKNAGAGKTVNITGITLGGSDASNYTLASANASTTASITPKSIAGSISAEDKTYDGSTSATTSSSLSGVIDGDAVSLSSSGSFADKNAGNGKRVNVSGSLSGADAGNYTLGSTNAATTASITAKSITGSISAEDKTYD
ncbi:GLUG motif-containing protein, partial [Pseudomonas oryzihabitans]|uniref:GLUG motif-containing protein n=1 Tax=Pseudomonas oryzihabitans TaxID=47885 RepID=UPI002894C7CF